MNDSLIAVIHSFVLFRSLSILWTRLKFCSDTRSCFVRTNHRSTETWSPLQLVLTVAVRNVDDDVDRPPASMGKVAGVGKRRSKLSLQQKPS